MKMSKKILAAAAVVLPLSIGAGSALAYFTANVEAGGAAMAAIGMDTEIHETVEGRVKNVTIHNDATAGPVYVRVKAFADSLHEPTYGGTDWEEGEDGYWYYKPVLEPDKDTSLLVITIKNKLGDNAPELSDFNVVVVYEQIPVEYVTGEDGQITAKSPTADDWKNATVKTEDVAPETVTED